MRSENPFKMIDYPPKEVPQGLKDRVMANVNSAKLLMDLAALFTSNYNASLTSLFKTKKTK